ncbi:YitT family protein [Peptostreptococcus faecalis]|uniref:YitT family protein n=1 Tax=Peptostreptococcus faecalis TaxID=2045015 RepID=UPI000C7E74C3|nr:YitT family protein [Peptostreptococcus faecalis]
MKEFLKENLKDIPIVVLGNLAIAIAVVFFVLPNEILVGGTSGVTVVLSAFFDINKQLTVQLLTIGLFLLGSIILGKGFLIKTVVSAIASPLFISILGGIYNTLDDSIFVMDKLATSVISGVLIGLGVGMVYRKNGSTGGMDIIPLIVNKYTGASLAVLVMIVDGLTVLFGVVGYGLNAAFYGIVSVLVCSYIINKTLLLGTEKSKQVQIICESSKIIVEKISKDLDRGTTIIDAHGGYTKDKKEIVIAVVSIKEYPKLVDIVKEIDENAFMIISDVNQVEGRGFTLQRRYLH